MVRFWPLLVAAAAGLAVGSLTAGRPDAQSPAAVTIKTFQFAPNPLAVKAGTAVTWTNEDEIRHTVASGSPASRDDRFGAPLPDKGATYRFTFTEPGTYPYFCERHPNMRGEVRVG